MVLMGVELEMSPTGSWFGLSCGEWWVRRLWDSEEVKYSRCEQIAKGGLLEVTSTTLVSVLSLCPDLVQSDLPSLQCLLPDPPHLSYWDGLHLLKLNPNRLFLMFLLLDVLSTANQKQPRQRDILKRPREPGGSCAWDQPGLTLKLMPLILALGKQKQKDLSELKVSLAYVVSFKPVGATYWYLLSEKKHKDIHLLILLKCIQIAELVGF